MGYAVPGGYNQNMAFFKTGIKMFAYHIEVFPKQGFVIAWNLNVWHLFQWTKVLNHWGSRAGWDLCTQNKIPTETLFHQSLPECLLVWESGEHLAIHTQAQ